MVINHMSRSGTQIWGSFCHCWQWGTVVELVLPRECYGLSHFGTSLVHWAVLPLVWGYHTSSRLACKLQQACWRHRQPGILLL